MSAPRDLSRWAAGAARVAAPAFAATLGGAFLRPAGGFVGFLAGCLATVLLDVLRAEEIDHRGRTVRSADAPGCAVSQVT